VKEFFIDENFVLCRKDLIDNSVGLHTRIIKSRKKFPQKKENKEKKRNFSS